MFSIFGVSSLFVTAAIAVPAGRAAPNACPAPPWHETGPPQLPFSSYAALGDSYAAGQGSVERLKICDSPLDPADVASNTCTSLTCKKDIGSYAYQFAQKHNLMDEFLYFACSGADTSNVTNNQVGSSYFNEPDLVTVQVGGDDYDSFTNVLTSCIAEGDDACKQAVSQTNLTQILLNVNNTLSAIDAKAHTNHKALIGYVQFFRPDYEGTCNFSYQTNNTSPPSYTPINATSRSLVNNLVLDANDRLSQLANSRGYLFVDANDLFASHRWCDKAEPWWIASTLTKYDIDTGGQNYNEFIFGHPSFEGQGAYLQALESVLGINS